MPVPASKRPTPPWRRCAPRRRRSSVWPARGESRGACRPGRGRSPGAGGMPSSAPSSSRRNAPDLTGRTASGPGPSGGSSATSGGGASSGCIVNASRTGSGARRRSRAGAARRRRGRRCAPGAGGRALLAVASASGSARCVGHESPSSSASTGSAWRSSSGYSRSAASSVSNQSPRSGGVPPRRAAAARYSRSKEALCPTSVASPANSRSPARASAIPGAPATSTSEMPVRRATNSGMGLPGSTRVVKRSVTVRSCVQADGADVDDAVADGVETGGLGVDEDESGASPGHGPRIAEPAGLPGSRPARAVDLQEAKLPMAPAAMVATRSRSSA